jgi:hypothetical protein
MNTILQTVSQKSKLFHLAQAQKGNCINLFHLAFETVLACRFSQKRNCFTLFHRHKTKLKNRFSQKKMYRSFFLLTAES